MKYYIYISDTKVDMLYPQIPKSILKRIASTLNIDLKFLGAEINIGAKSNQSDETRYSKVRIVSEYIEKHLDVGTINAPSTYFKGKLAMQWGQISSGSTQDPNIHSMFSQTVYFSGSYQHIFIGLCGSMQHVLGKKKGETNDINLHLPPSSLMGFMEVLKMIDEIDNFDQSPFSPSTERDLLEMIYKATVPILGPKQNLEFLAKTLLQGNYRSGEYIILGTPIYVAIAD